MAEVLTQYSGMFVGPIARLLGYIMNWIFMFMDKVFGNQNIGICIILFTIVIYICLLPLTIKQQKFSKMQRIMQPELQAIQKKYKGKKDQESMMKMNEETQALYSKYGVSAMGSCVQLLIQMPILLGLYQVIYNIPAYVSSVKTHFMPVVEGIIGTNGYKETLTDFVEKIGLARPALNFSGTEEQAVNSIIDVLYKLPTTAWDGLKDSFSNLTGVIETLEGSLEQMNYFLGINIANSPMQLIKSGWSAGQYLLVLGAILVPVISAGTQFLNLKIMPTAAASTGDQEDAMMSSMKTMNYMMPILSFVMVLNVPVGMGIYWITGPVIRTIQQLIINKFMDKMDIDKLIKKNEEKAKKKREKKGIYENQISNAARMNTRKLSDRAVVNADNEEKLRQVYDNKQNAKPGSLTAKANMVKEFNERNNRQ